MSLRNKLRVMSFNIRYGTAQDGENSWPLRKELVIERIHAFKPHLLGIQECRADGQFAYLKENLSEYKFIGVPRGLPLDSLIDGELPDEGILANLHESALEMAPLGFLKETFELVESGHFWLSSTPDVPASKFRRNAFPRTTTWAILKQKVAPQRLLLFCNNHFDYAHTDARSASARLLRRYLARLGKRLPRIVTGDFNAGKDEPAYSILLQGTTRHSQPLYDAYRQIHGPGTEEGTLHGFGQYIPPSAIDWIMVSGHFQVQSAQIDRAAPGGRYPSDHYPVQAELEWM